jgi:hypothetical protein
LQVAAAGKLQLILGFLFRPYLSPPESSPRTGRSAFSGRKSSPSDGLRELIPLIAAGVDPFTLHIYAALAQQERLMISQRTRVGLAAAKARGVQLGNADLAKANRGAALERAEALRPVFVETADLSAHKAADVLNSRQIATPTGRPWSAKTVIRVRARLGLAG